MVSISTNYTSYVGYVTTVSTILAVSTSTDFTFIVGCPNCKTMCWVDYVVTDMLSNTKVLGICPECGTDIVVQLISQKKNA